MLPGTCVRALDKVLRPPSRKRFVCIEPSYLWFLRINSKSVWPPHCFISVYECDDILDHDSYVELSIIHRLSNVPYELRSGDCEDLGVMPAAPFARVVSAVLEADTIPRDQKNIIEACIL